MTRVPAEAALNTKSAAENSSTFVYAGQMKPDRRPKSRLSGFNITICGAPLLFLSNVDGGNTEGEFMEMDITETDIGKHP